MSKTEVVPQISEVYPRVYRPKSNWRVLTVLAAVMSMVALAGMFYLPWHSGRTPTSAMVFFSLVFLLAAYGVGWSRAARITLWGDRIEVRGLFRTRTLTFNEIVGIRTDYSTNETARIVFESRNQGPTGISRAYDFDECYRQWMSSLTDLNAEDRRASEESVKNNEQFGRRRLDRVHALRRADRVGTWFNVGAFVLFFWGCVVFVPLTVSAAVLVVFPWLTVLVAWRSRGLFTFEQNTADVRPRLTIPYLLPGIALLVRVFVEVKLVDWKGPLYLTLGVAGALAVSALIAGRPWTNPRVWAVLLFVLALPYGFGASMQANFRFDRSESREVRARVVSKEKHNSRSSFYYLELAPWGPQTQFDRVGVWWNVYKSVSPGEDVCIKLRDGALGVPWYTVHECGKGR